MLSVFFGYFLRRHVYLFYTHSSAVCVVCKYFWCFPMTLYNRNDKQMLTATNTRIAK